MQTSVLILALCAPLISAVLGSDGTCVYNNVTYNVGEEFPKGDGCNNCTCHDSFVSCSKCLCLDFGRKRLTFNVNDNTLVTSTVINLTEPVTCIFNGVTYSLAQGHREIDGCTRCSCTQLGMACSSLGCPLHLPSRTDRHKCLYAGVIHNFGTTFQHTDGCNMCVCALDSIQCTDSPACKAMGT